ncbi:MAG TPA: alpha-L-fucosidase [Candidatus Lokiarchaeia archaeon]|nr:alpha-L-fucosidase [Candidatus Lokiarchaeia archaeon]
MQPPNMTYKGTVIKKDDQLFLRTRYLPTSPEIDVPFDELLEDYENLGIEMNLYRRNFGEPIWKNIVGEWDTELETTTDSDYEHCSDEGRERFLDMKVGLMVHFGMYSHIGSVESWAAYAKNAPSWFFDIYYTLWQVFNPTEFDAEEWARLVERSGLQFIQITSKHCEGFALWDTKAKVRVPKRIGPQNNVALFPIEETYINYSVMDSPFKRDIIKELSQAFRKHGLGFGIYYSWWDWEDPNFRWDDGNRCFDPAYTPEANPEEWRAMIEREQTHLQELLGNYGPLDQIFFDTTWFGLSWNEFKDIVKMCRKLQPDCMFSDRGLGPYGDFTSPERWIPNEPGTQDPRVRGRIWQLCDPIGTHWSYVPGEIYKPKTVLLHNMIDVVAKGGCMVFDQGPMPNGRFPQEAVDVLETIGRWLKVNGEVIYATRSFEPYKEGEDTYFTRSKDNTFVYLIHVGWPFPSLTTSSVKPREGSEIHMLGVQEPVDWHLDGDALVIELPPSFNDKIPCEYAYCFKIEQA